MKQVEIIKGTGKPFNENPSGNGKKRVAPYCRVSTDHEEQLSSHKSQVAYYTEYVGSREDWILVDIYADEAITGTSTKNRVDFQRLISDCISGKVDMVITKTISRFARNTLDTLKYVRLLKSHGVAVFFEKENINTLTMDGELLLVILSSVAQQEVENISANVRKGLQMKMRRGELVGRPECLGYDYDPITKSISVNPIEAETVRYIFKRYTEGVGAFTIRQELEKLGHITKNGKSNWSDHAVINVIKNEKYIGNLRQGKYYTVDPFTKVRRENFGEQDTYYVREHHEPIISVEVFYAAQEILSRRQGDRKGTRVKYSRKYAFSSMLECGFCGTSLSRRIEHQKSPYEKAVWMCIAKVKKLSVKNCTHAKAVAETIIGQAFVESYRRVYGDDKESLNELLREVEQSLSKNDPTIEIAKIDKELSTLTQKRRKLLDTYLDCKVDEETYELKLADLTEKTEILLSERNALQKSTTGSVTLQERLKVFRKLLEQNGVITEFSREIFESVIEKVIVGTTLEDGTPDPYMLTFIYKTGYGDEFDSGSLIPKRRGGGNKKPRNGLETEQTDSSVYYDNNECCGSANYRSTKVNGFVFEVPIS
jgi:DNA invertase Pin-like site-specific DNA recombinase